MRLSSALPLVLLLSSSMSTAAGERSVRVFLGAAPDALSVGKDEVPLSDAARAVSADERPDVVLLGLGEGKDLPARSVVRTVDRLLRAGVPVRAAPPRTKQRRRGRPDALPFEEWRAGGPAVAEVAVDGALPAAFAIAGEDAWLATDLRGAVRLDDDETVRTFPVGLLDGDAPGVPAPTATVALSIGEAARARTLFLLLGELQRAGWGRVLLVVDQGGEPAGLPLSLAEGGDRPGPLPHRREPPSARSAPAFRAMRVIVEEALLALRLEVDADGTVDACDAFTEPEATALALSAFLAAGVRAGDGTPSGRAVLQLERAVAAWPPDDRRKPRREEAIACWGAIEAYARSHHPLLRPAAQAGLDRIGKRILAEKEYREGIPKGFQGIAIAHGVDLGLDGAEALAEKFESLADAVLEPETNLMKSNWSTRNSVDPIALANVYVLLGADANDPRVKGLATQAARELPSTDSGISNEKRALSAFFQSRLALNAGGPIYDEFVSMLKESLPKAPPEPIDIEEIEPDRVKSPWSGGGNLHSAARVALMAIAYTLPDEKALEGGGGKRRGRRR